MMFDKKSLKIVHNDAVNVFDGPLSDENVKKMTPICRFLPASKFQKTNYIPLHIIL